MSNTVKALIVATIAIIAISGTYILTKSRPLENGPNTGISSDSRASSSASSKAFTSSSSQNTSKLTGVSSSSKSEQPKSEIAQLPKTEIVDGVEITYLDSKNPPQYIKDYVNCETKDLTNSDGKLTHYGIFFKDLKNNITYRCPPKMESVGCQKNIIYINNFDKEVKQFTTNGLNNYPYKIGWNCDLFYASQIAYPFMVDVCNRFGENLPIYISEDYKGNASENSGGCISTSSIVLKSTIPEYFHFNKIITLK
jgi:hypothetical protein